MSRLAALPLVLLVALAACAADPQRADEAPPAPVVAEGLDFTRTSEVRFGGTGEPSGYLVEFLRVPTGVIDQRVYREGTALVQDARLADVGFVSPAGVGYRFDAEGHTVDLGFGSRNAHIATLLGGSGKPTLTVVK
ncbi:MAG: hypothetical protein H6825_16870 [Planctomycetes bacterium]|nr:hypothetical protein [Planctomycetota bacterium]